MPSFGIFAQKVKRGGSAGRRLPSGDGIGERAHPQSKVAHFAKYIDIHRYTKEMHMSPSMSKFTQGDILLT